MRKLCVSKKSSSATHQRAHAVAHFFHSSSQRLFDYKSYRMILIIQAMTELGESGIIEEVRSKLKEQLALVSGRDFIHDLKLAPIWAQTILRGL